AAAGRRRPAQPAVAPDRPPAGRHGSWVWVRQWWANPRARGWPGDRGRHDTPGPAAAGDAMPFVAQCARGAAARVNRGEGMNSLLVWSWVFLVFYIGLMLGMGYLGMRRVAGSD